MVRSIPCPKCAMSLLEPVQEQGVEVDACLKCGGLWFDAGDLAKVIRAYDPKAINGDRVADELGRFLGRTQYACPRCGKGLEEHQLSTLNTVQVDVCRGCGGVWVEHEEYAHAVAGRLVANAEQAIDAKPSWGSWFIQFLTGLPVEFNIAPRRLPVVTYGLVAANYLVFTVAALVISDNSLLLDMLVLDPAATGTVPWFFTLISSQFAHAGIIHLLGNMYFLWILGDNVEDVFGRAEYLLFYLGAGICGGIVYCLAAGPGQVGTVGASGAISGVIAAYAILFSRSKLTVMLLLWQFKLPARAWMTLWVVFNLIGWFRHSPGVAWEAHLGGLAFGLIVATLGYRGIMRKNPALRLLHRG